MLPVLSYHDEPTLGIHPNWVCANIQADRLLAKLCSPANIVCNLQEALRKGLVSSQIQLGVSSNGLNVLNGVRRLS